MTVLDHVPRAKPRAIEVAFSWLFFPIIQTYKGLPLTGHYEDSTHQCGSANATNAETKLKKRALGTLKPYLTRILKCPICRKG